MIAATERLPSPVYRIGGGAAGDQLQIDRDRMALVGGDLVLVLPNARKRQVFRRWCAPSCALRDRPLLCGRRRATRRQDASGPARAEAEAGRSWRRCSERNLLRRTRESSRPSPATILDPAPAANPGIGLVTRDPAGARAQASRDLRPIGLSHQFPVISKTSSAAPSLQTWVGTGGAPLPPLPRRARPWLTWLGEIHWLHGKNSSPF